MLFLPDPATGATFRYSDRKNSKVVVQNKLPVKTYRILMEIIFRREYIPYDNDKGEIVTKYILFWAENIVYELFFGHPISISKTNHLVFNVNLLKTRVRVSYDDHVLLHRLFQNEKGKQQDFINHLSGVIAFFFFNPKKLRLIAKPPRGAKAEQQFLLNALTGALFACRELVIKAEKGDRRLKNKIENIINSNKKYLSYLQIHENPLAGDDIQYIEENDVSPSFRQQATIICLVDHGFQGAWEAYGHPGLLNRSPQDIFRDFLYGKKQRPLAQLLKNCDNEIRQKALDCSIEMYLSDVPGAAAKGLGLI